MEKVNDVAFSHKETSYGNFCIVFSLVMQLHLCYLNDINRSSIVFIPPTAYRNCLVTPEFAEITLRLRAIQLLQKAFSLLDKGGERLLQQFYHNL
jgi:hypothetical protein